jgi:rare lipoprotein A (peptidoglycan hydrolase)
METAQVQQLKLNATNIKSVLIRSNTELRKIKLQKRDLINSEIDKEKKREKEKKLESGIKSSLNKVKNAVFSGPMNIFDKIMEFAGIILLGILVNNLPTIISKLEGFFRQNSAFINGVIQVIKFIGSGIASLSGLVSNLSSGKQNQIAGDRKKIDQDLGGLKQQLSDASSKTNDIRDAINSKKKPSGGASGGGQQPVKRAKGGIIPSRQPQTTKSTSPAFTAGETGRAKRARQTTNYFGTFNQAVKDSSENSITDQDNLGLFEKMANNFKKFSEFMQTSMRSPLDTQSPDGGGSPPGGGIPIDVDPDEVIGKVGYTGSVVPSGPDGSHIHIEKVGGGSIASDVKNNIYVSGLPMPSRLRFTSGIGYRWGRMHAGEDFAGDPDQPITLRGGLKFVGYSPDNGSGYGNRVTIQAPDGTRYTLNHLNAGPTNAKELVKRQNKNQQNLGNFALTGKENSGKASFYGGPTDTYWEGRKTASGERFDSNLMTAASNTIKLGSYVRVTNNNNGKSVIVKINDTGGFGSLGRIIDLSAGAMRELGGISAGVIPVKVEVLKRKAKVTPPPSQVAANKAQQLIASMAQVPQSSVILGIQQYQTFVPIPYTLPGQNVDTSSASPTPLPSIWKK